MKIAIATVQVPFTTGGAEVLVNMLKTELKKRGHQADIVSIPFKWYPWQNLVNCMTMGRMMDLTEISLEKIDMVIAMKFPAYYVKHDHKVMWLMHQHRSAYDLWETKFEDMHRWPNGKAIRDFIRQCDEKYIPEATRVFTIAGTTSARLKKYNGIDSTVLYHPPQDYEKLYCGECGDYIFYPSRINEIKRQTILAEAARYLTTDAKIVIAGGGTENEIRRVTDIIEKYDLGDRVRMAGFISDEEKIRLYANCLGVYFGAYNEDYGYITLESFFSEKPVIVHTDSGGPLEFVEDGKNGFVIPPDPKAVAEKIDWLYRNRGDAQRMGAYGKQSLITKNMDWDYVIDQLLYHSDREEGT